MNSKNKNHLKLNIIFGFLALLLVLGFQNCSQLNRGLNFVTTSPALEVIDPLSPIATTRLNGGGSGDGYIGKPDFGKWVRTGAEVSCSKQVGVQSVIDVKSDSADLTQDNCQTTNKTVFFSEPVFDYRPYNKTMMWMGNAVFQKADTFDASVSQNYGLCRTISMSPALDLILSQSVQSRKFSGRILKANFSDGKWDIEQSNDFALERKLEFDKIVLSSANIKIEISSAKNSKNINKAKVVAIVSGEDMSQELDCMMSSELPAVTENLTGAIAKWEFENGSLINSILGGTNLVANDSDGTINYQNSVIANGINLDGNDDYLLAANSSSFHNMAQLSISAWINPFEQLLYPGSGNSQGGIVHKSESANVNRGWNFGVGAGTPQLLFHSAFTGRNLFVNTDVPLNLFTWNHVAVVWDGSPNPSQLRLFINGVLANSGKQIDGAFYSGIGSRIDDSTVPLTIGDFSDDQQGQFRFRGGIDQLMIFNRQLSDAEVMQLFQKKYIAN